MTDVGLHQRLKKARALIADPRHWTQRSEARDKWRHAVSPRSPKAERFCAIGACKAVSALERNPQEMRLALEACTKENIISVNDGDHERSRSASHRAILDAFDCAIERTK